MQLTSESAQRIEPVLLSPGSVAAAEGGDAEDFEVSPHTPELVTGYLHRRRYRVHYRDAQNIDGGWYRDEVLVEDPNGPVISSLLSSGRHAPVFDINGKATARVVSFGPHRYRSSVVVTGCFEADAVTQASARLVAERLLSAPIVMLRPLDQTRHGRFARLWRRGQQTTSPSRYFGRLRLDMPWSVAVGSSEDGTSSRLFIETEMSWDRADAMSAAFASAGLLSEDRPFVAIKQRILVVNYEPAHIAW